MGCLVDLVRQQYQVYRLLLELPVRQQDLERLQELCLEHLVDPVRQMVLECRQDLCRQLCLEHLEHQLDLFLENLVGLVRLQHLEHLEILLRQLNLEHQQDLELQLVPERLDMMTAVLSSYHWNPLHLLCQQPHHF